MSMIKKALGTLLREALEARGLPVVIKYQADGAMRYEINGVLYSPGDAARLLGVSW